MLRFFPQRKYFYHLHCIPLSVRHLFNGRIQCWRSLRTTDKDTATVRSASWNARLVRLFTILKKDGGRMTREQVDALIARYMESSLDEGEDFRATCGPVTDAYRDDQWMGLSIQFDEVSEALVSCDFRKIEREAVDLLKTAGLPQLDVNGAEFGRLCRRLLSAKQEVLRVEADRWNGDYEEHRAVSSQVVKGGDTVATPVVTPAASQVASPTVTVQASPLFTEVLSRYAREHNRPERTERQMQAEFKRFITVIGGDRAIASITKADGRLYKDDLLITRKLALLTAIRHIIMLNCVFRWAEAQGYIPDRSNPITGLAPNARYAKKAATLRRPFTDTELLKVFGSKEFIKQREAQPARYWLVLICLFQVCRREEAGQLSLADIGEQEGIPFLNITDAGEGQSVKNVGSKRRLPLHSSLIQLGFLEYVQHTKKGGHSRLFPSLKRGRNGYSDLVGKWFSRLVTKCGITDPAIVLHSLRHGGITKLTAAGVPDHIKKVISGHASSGVHDQVYVHREGLPLSLLKDGLEKLKYDSVLTVLTKEKHLQRPSKEDV